MLSTSRQQGFSVGYIPMSEIEAYMRIMRIDDDEEREEFLFLIQAMDAEYVEWASKKTKAK